MALPIIYVNTAGSALNSGSTDNTSPITGSAATVVGSVVTLDGSPDLSGVPTDGSATINLADATNSNQKIFKITAVDNTLKTVTVSVAPTGVVSSAWRIGGQFVLTVASIEGALAAGWIVEFGNAPATVAGPIMTARASGDNASGPITIRGKSGVMPVLTITGTGNIIAVNSQTGWTIRDLEGAQQGASGNAFASGSNWSFVNVKVSDAGGDGIALSNGCRARGCAVSGAGGHGISSTLQNMDIMGCYIHDVTGDGLSMSAANPSLSLYFNIVDTCGGRGVLMSGASTNLTHLSRMQQNTVYGCGNSGLEVTDADTILSVFGNIFVDNGNAAGESNVEWVAGAAENVSAHGFNCFYQSGATVNLAGLTLAANEIITDPQLVDPANGDFRIKPGSPARSASFPGQFLGGGSSVGYLDMGAVQAIPRPITGVGLHRIELGIAA